MFVILLQFREAFQRVSSPTHFRTTVLLANLHILLGFVYMGVSTFSTNQIKQLRQEEYLSMRQYVYNANYTDLILNETIENVQYKNSLFKNVTFTHMNLNHVEFLNCSIEDVEFINVKSSITYFQDSIIKDCK